jgi:hypothetical protein
MNAILSLITMLLPKAVGNAALIGTIIDGLVALTPIIVQEYRDLKPIVANILTALRSDPATLKDQLAALDAFEERLDASYREAAALAAAEDAAFASAKS